MQRIGLFSHTQKPIEIPHTEFPSRINQNLTVDLVNINQYVTVPAEV